MFTIIGGDGKEYGPATVAQVRSWVAAGRANLDSKAKAAGSDEWRRLGDYAEFLAPTEPPPLIEVGAASEDPTLAERWQRFVGALIDGLLEMLCWIPASVAVMSAFRDIVSAGSVNPSELQAELVPVIFRSMWHSLPYLAVLTLLQAILLSVRSQSVGNLIMRTRIVRVSDGEPGGFLRAFLLRGALARVLRQVPIFGGLFWIVDSCFIFREDRRCLHDLIAGTKVVKL